MLRPQIIRPVRFLFLFSFSPPVLTDKRQRRKCQLFTVSQCCFSSRIVSCENGRVFVNLGPAGHRGRRRRAAAGTGRQRKYAPGAPEVRVQVFLQAALSGAKGRNGALLGVRWK